MIHEEENDEELIYTSTEQDSKETIALFKDLCSYGVNRTNEKLSILCSDDLYFRLG